jgi:hypothetical protein
MADVDDWDAEDFEVPVIDTAVSPKGPENATEDEEDLALREETVKIQQSASQLAAQEKKAKEQEKILAEKAKFAVYENETASERKLREAKQLEDAETSLAGEMLGGGSKGGKSESSGGGAESLTKGLGAISLKSREDHVKYGTVTRQKLSASSGFNIAAFYKSLSKVLDAPAITAEALDEIINDLTAIRDTKAKAAKQTQQKKSKKEIEKAKKEHANKFGDVDGGNDKYDKYVDMEDDFM